MREGALFFTRGIRLLGTDLQSAGRLFTRAGAGASLKPREARPSLDVFIVVLCTACVSIPCLLAGGDLCRAASATWSACTSHHHVCM